MGVVGRSGRVRMFGMIALALLAVAVVLVGRHRSGRPMILRPDPEPVLAVPVGEVVGGVAVGDSVVVVLSQRDRDGAGHDRAPTTARTTLVRLDPVTGAERDRATLGDLPAMDGVAELDGDLVLRLGGRLADVAAVPLPEAEAAEAATFDDEVWLTVIDGATLAPVRQYQLPPFRYSPRTDRVTEPLVVIDGVYWMLGAGSRRARIDLRTGTTWFARDVPDRSISGVVWTDDRLVVVAWEAVWIVDRATGELLATHEASEFSAMAAASQPVDFRTHEGRVWVAPLIRDVEDLPLRLDLETGELLDDRPRTPIPGSSFESGGSRWELTGRRVVVTDRSVPVPEPGDRWRQVDPDSNEVLARFDLGSWQPIFATPDHLWVTGASADGPGRQLSRLPLDSPSGG